MRSRARRHGRRLFLAAGNRLSETGYRGLIVWVAGG